jgi:transposase
MIAPPAGARIWIAAGVTDLRRGFTGLSAAVQTVLEEDPYGGHVFVFRGRRGDLVKLLWWDGDGFVFLPSVWSADVSFGRRLRPEPCHLLERSYRCYSKGLTGGGRRARGSQKWLFENREQKQPLMFEMLSTKY